jgi:20S proteasome subunit beta 6
LAAAGCHADCIALQRQLLYQSKARGNDMELPTPNVAQLLSQTLYARRTFPYYSFCVVAGLKDGCGQAYQYDAIGSREQVAVATAGTGRELLQPILDRLLSSSNQDESVVTDTADQALQGVIKAYQAVAEREISVGDSLLICVLQRKPKGESALVTCKVQLVELKRH